MPPSGDQARNPGICPDWESTSDPLLHSPVLNSLSHTSQGRFIVLNMTFPCGWSYWINDFSECHLAAVEFCLHSVIFASCIVWLLADWIQCRRHSEKCLGSGAGGAGLLVSHESWLLMVFWLHDHGKVTEFLWALVCYKECDNVTHALPTSLGGCVAEVMHWGKNCFLGDYFGPGWVPGIQDCTKWTQILSFCSFWSSGEALNVYQGWLESLALDLDYQPEIKS